MSLDFTIEQNKTGLCSPDVHGQPCCLKKILVQIPVSTDSLIVKKILVYIFIYLQNIVTYIAQQELLYMTDVNMEMKLCFNCLSLYTRHAFYLLKSSPTN